jgi:site-specific DNA-methyltransferase (adenine-specific)/modification methylase
MTLVVSKPAGTGINNSLAGDHLHPENIVNALFEGDCIALLQRFPEHCVDLILCDLPYGTTQNPWDSPIHLNDLWAAYRHVLKPSGTIVLTGQGLFTARLIISNEKWFRYKLVWEKSKPTNFLNARRQPLRKHEDICVFAPRGSGYFPQMSFGAAYDKGVRKNQLSGSYGDFLPARVRSQGQRFPTDVIYFKTAESEGQVWHPTQKPVALGRYLIRTYSRPGELVLDNAFGSGSFLVAALLEGRRFCGIEKNGQAQLFKKTHIDFIALTAQRLGEAWQYLDEATQREMGTIRVQRKGAETPVLQPGIDALGSYQLLE